MKQKNKTIIIIDGNALVHRAFHALPDTLRTKKGVLTNAVYGFMLVFLKVLDEFKPDYAAACFDRKERLFATRLLMDTKPSEKERRMSFTSRFHW
ncbi:MAG: PIN domain-containing protein [Patescibacteria group bacterium]